MRIIIAVLGLIAISTAAYAHGGGCRKNSPAGQCCHMDHKTGQFHCH